VAALTAGADRERAVDWAQVRTVLWAQWRLGTRVATRSRWMLVLTTLGWVLYVGVVAALSAGAFFATFAARQHAGLAATMPALVHVAFLFVLVALSVSPALGLRGNEFLDVTKLFVYPVNHRTVFASSLLGLVVSKSVLFFALPLLAAVAGWSASPGALVGGLLATLLLVLVAVALGQTILLVFLDLFRSRRWRDVSRIAGALIGAGIYGGMRFLSGEAIRTQGRNALEQIEAWRNWAAPLPSWWAAHAVTGAGWTRWLPALALPVLLFWLVLVAARFQERAYFGEIEERRERVTGSGGGLAGWFGRRVRDPAGAEIEKDLRLLLRDPTVRIQLIQQFAFVVIPFVAIFLRRDGPPPEGLIAGFAYLPVLTSMALTMNPLGTEGGGMQHALLTPVRRATIVLGKVLALTIVVGGMFAALVGAGAFLLSFLGLGAGVAGSLGRAALACVEALCVYAAFAGVGSVVGAYLPWKMVTRSQRALRQTSGGRQGCARALLSFASLGVGGVLCVPISLAFHHPLLAELAKVDSRPFLALTVPAAAAYAAFLLWAGTRVAGGVLERREEAVLDVMNKPSE
jgi:ABC-2 type transport system permease protein